MPKTAYKQPAARSGRKQRAVKAKKDPNAPKRALSAYMFYSQENREKIKSENPEASFGEMGRIMGERWKTMTDAQKKSYVEKSDRDKSRYEKEKAEYQGRGGAAAVESEEE